MLRRTDGTSIFTRNEMKSKNRWANFFRVLLLIFVLGIFGFVGTTIFKDVLF